MSDRTTEQDNTKRQEGAGGVSESRLMAQDSDLNDAVVDNALDSDQDGDEGGDIAGGDAGVLGMIYQFSKAQTEKGTGVNI